MVTTHHSWEYTSYALKSFAKHTPLRPGDHLCLIDNDRSFGTPPTWVVPTVELISHDTPHSFAANVNIVMARAQELGSDLFFLNNDIIFTPGWIDPLLIDEPKVLSPLSNREVQYEVGGFVWKNVLTLADYINRAPALRELLALHKSKCQGYRPVVSLPFFCIKIPHAVYTAVGSIDESFGVGGAEDNDYCLRVIEAGFSVEYAMSSYVLHFSGKSTWAGAETKEQTEGRVAKYRAQFQAKWGSNLRQLIIDEDPTVLDRNPIAKEAASKGDFKAMIAALR